MNAGRDADRIGQVAIWLGWWAKIERADDERIELSLTPLARSEPDRDRWPHEPHEGPE